MTELSRQEFGPILEDVALGAYCTFSVAVPTILLYVAFTVYVPARTLLFGRNPSPVFAPVPATKVGLKFEVWSVFVASTTVQVVPSAGFVISVEPFAKAWK